VEFVKKQEGKITSACAKKNSTGKIVNVIDQVFKNYDEKIKLIL
jgi:hypothetical protein